jgi:DNA-directed RNA polymerase subunit beta'
VGQKETVKALDRLKQLGFREASRSGISIGITDMMIPEAKKEALAAAYKEIEIVEKQYRNGIITNGERQQKVIDVWTKVGDQVADELYRTIEFNEGKKHHNPLYVMVTSGARGNRTQIKQLGGMRGLMAKPSGEIIERPITSNFREGLSVLEYFISTHGARKGLADTALKTADSGYMTRKLVDVSQDVIVTELDCGTVNGITLGSIFQGDEEVVDLKTRVYGRTSCESVHDPVDRKKFIVKAGQLILEEEAAHLQKIGVEKMKIRSVLTCESKRGCCAKCYGLHLGAARMAKLGEAVGIVAAQSIGEPGTQLTMRTFHVGGAAMSTFKQPFIIAKNGGLVRYHDMRAVKTIEGTWIALTKNGTVSILDEDGKELESHKLVVGAVIAVEDGGKAKKGQQIVTWDPYNMPIICEKAGKIEFRDMLSGVTITK